MTHFGRRGREGLRALKKSSFTVVTDSDGRGYLAMVFNESDKTHHDIDSREKNKATRMNETGTENFRLTKIFIKVEFRLSHFFQRPLTKFISESKTWYAKEPVGLNYSCLAYHQKPALVNDIQTIVSGQW